MDVWGLYSRFDQHPLAPGPKDEKIPPRFVHVKDDTVTLQSVRLNLPKSPNKGINADFAGFEEAWESNARYSTLAMYSMYRYISQFITYFLLLTPSRSALPLMLPPL